MNWWEDPKACEELKKRLEEPIAEEYAISFWTKVHHNENIINRIERSEYELEKGAVEGIG
jgi:hypothetical protein